MSILMCIQILSKYSILLKTSNFHIITSALSRSVKIGIWQAHWLDLKSCLNNRINEIWVTFVKTKKKQKKKTKKKKKKKNQQKNKVSKCRVLSSECFAVGHPKAVFCCSLSVFVLTVFDIYEPAHDKIYNKACVTSEDSVCMYRHPERQEFSFIILLRIAWRL